MIEIGTNSYVLMVPPLFSFKTLSIDKNKGTGKSDPDNWLSV